MRKARQSGSVWMSMIARLALLLSLLPAATLADYLVGRATVTDGETIRMGDVRIRLWGIDAPERDQTCGDLPAGRMATGALAHVIGDRPVSCESVDTDRYGRTVATCAVDGEDLGSMMVRAGWARDYARYSGGHYRQDEDAARTRQRGMWAADCIAPWEWRRR